MEDLIVDGITLPKDIVRAARSARIIDDAQSEKLLAIIDDRNRMVHDYSEEYALKLIETVREVYAPVL